ncbi:RAD54A [Auxenochlorella protothecoides x Auxenochlorella symbiontica]
MSISSENQALPASVPTLGLKRKAFKAPLAVRPAVSNIPPAAREDAGPKPVSASEEHYYFNVLYTKHNPGKLRKNKSWADGVLEMRAGGRTTLFDTSGKSVTQTVARGYDPPSMGEGSSVLLGGWELEVQNRMEAAEFRSGTAFIGPSAGAVAPLPKAASTTTSSTGLKGRAAFRPVVPAGVAAQHAAVRKAPAWLHDPMAETAIVLNREQWMGSQESGASGVRPVVVDPYLACHLRPHQVEGVRFLYECVVSGPPGQRGAILADEMGLGKTLQVLTLLWTLLRQNPQGSKPLVTKAIVVAPTTLVRNWEAEVRRWLGPERLRPLSLVAGPAQAEQVLGFVHGAAHALLITSYELARRHAGALAGAAQLLVCDEGHRLKAAAGSKTISALGALGCPARVLLTGTPVQNAPREFFAMADFVRPGVLGDLPAFERVFGGPIARAQDRAGTEEDKALGRERARELVSRISGFMLRRTAEVNARFLPPLSVYIVFCRPSELQLREYRRVLQSAAVHTLLSNGPGDQALAVLSSLRKICNHPYLAPDPDRDAGPTPDTSPRPADSGKLAALDAMLAAALADPGERAVVVSQSTAALDLIGALCATRGWPCQRLDGATDPARRVDMVDAFNRHGVGRVFLLSTTAGGAGLNLVGAARLFLFDSHWNPAMDRQAMARIWRDGQKKACTVYRLLTTGTIDEKMYQRQRMKGDMAAGVQGGAAGGAGGGGRGPEGAQFSREELRELFVLKPGTDCETRDLLQATGAAFADGGPTCADPAICAAAGAGLVSFVHLESEQGGGA